MFLLFFTFLRICLRYALYPLFHRVLHAAGTGLKRKLFIYCYDFTICSRQCQIIFDGKRQFILINMK